jgi:hypothetical protein
MQASVLQSQSSATAAPISETSRSTSQGIQRYLSHEEASKQAAAPKISMLQGRQPCELLRKEQVGLLLALDISQG